jgi:membrane protease YdiL (CAAX protease family)
MRTRTSIRNPIPGFIVLAVLLGGGVIILVVQGVIPGQLAMLSVLSASIAGIVMTVLDEGAAGLKALLRRLLIWRVGIGYWLFAVFFALAVILAGSRFNILFDGDMASSDGFNISFDILPMFFAFVTLSGVGQEIGWTGFLTIRLQSRFNALTTAVLRAILVWVWHFPLLYFARLQPAELADFPYGGWIAQKGFLFASLAHLLLFSLPWSVLFVWIFNNSRGSLLLTSVLHGSEIWVAYWMIKTGTDHALLSNYYGYAIMILLAAAIIVLIEGPRNLSRRYQRIQHSSNKIEGKKPG